ncbi:ABC transporter permease [Paenisporosarcina cavernae]|uniref:ABC transporter permease n=1 Tax=Paenisporosarcina cavernae TaxID=2320858 RepID=A0A385YPR1_9BACL|nr:ABC transporter permease [Paenisporosarcina cavernae]AYC28431.1 ABC transporter permease [Paenisporosarcina cavernae]
MIHLAKRVILQTLNDKRSIMMILFAPLLILTLVYFLLSDSDYIPIVAIDTSTTPAKLVEALQNEALTIESISSDEANSPETYLQQYDQVDAVLTLSSPTEGTISLVEPSTKATQTLQTIQQALSKVSPSANLKRTFLFGNEEQSTFDNLGYVFLALFSFFLVFIISAMALVRERTGGTLERLLMTPIKRLEVILGYIMGYGVFAIIQSVLLVVYAIYVLNLSLAGNIGWVVLTMVLLAVTAVSFGATISVFADSELQVVQMIPFTIIPQVFFSGLIPLDLIPFHLGYLAYTMPIFYGATAIKEVMVYGEGIAGIWGYLVGLLVYTTVLILLNTRVLKKFREL